MVARSFVLVLGAALTLAGLFVLLHPNTPAAGPQTREFDLRYGPRTARPT